MPRNDSERFAIQEEHRLEELCLEVTNACTHHGLHCAPRSGKSYPNELSLGKMQQFKSEAKTLGLRSLYLGGGEPFVRPEYTLELVESAGRGVKTTILTNGTIITESIADRLATFGSSTRLAISIFSACSGIHDHLTGTKGSLARMLRSTAACIGRGIDVGWGGC